MDRLKKIIDEVLTEKKKKRDRCLRIADRKFDKPSAYKSGAVVRCRKGDIWKGLKDQAHQVKKVDGQIATQVKKIKKQAKLNIKLVVGKKEKKEQNILHVDQHHPNVKILAKVKSGVKQNNIHGYF